MDNKNWNIIRRLATTTMWWGYYFLDVHYTMLLTVCNNKQARIIHNDIATIYCTIWVSNKWIEQAVFAVLFSSWCMQVSVLDELWIWRNHDFHQTFLPSWTLQSQKRIRTCVKQNAHTVQHRYRIHLWNPRSNQVFCHSSIQTSCP